ncbi:protein containg ATPase component of ABC transporter with duplicated ATPase domains [Longilinea arvoryzae]|uniref:ATP-binding protein Uup n=1 Tax=Longilinea arvoryzae TaxID=360412 RepID=A0A0S7B9R3_9CHLR|nr:ATP-binding cassette domain-containing protein [Longilinea arvoryzae]GAP14151.1 protein containg ATPase component of ABC transporter with duplicated ATPase domains [Longilinea arvoryzae]
MALISLQEVSLGFGGPLLLENINLQVEQGERIGLLGLNGVGKSTLLKMIHGDLEPDSGSLVRQQKLRSAYLPQEVPQDLSGMVYEIVASGLNDLAEQNEDAWQQQLQVDQVISRMQLDPQARFEILSAGMKRRVLLGRGLARNPDLLLLDEPTNHLDIDSINWLEDFLAHWVGTLLFVTHDRTFLQKMASRIVELDRGRLFDWNCNYATFLQRKEVMLNAETEQNLLFDKKLAQEEQWIRRGIEARRTRNEGRVRALKRLREIRRERREQPGKVRMQIQEERRSGNLVIEAEHIRYAYEGRDILRDFSTTIRRGDKVGIIGPNGSGKTTLLRLLMGELAPLAGEVNLGTNLEIAYFDQLRGQLDENRSVLDNVGEGRDTIVVNGKSRNIVGYLEDFLFSPDRVHAPISALSGGERNRLLLARLFAHPANLLVLDEPTNDLDIETLEILEDLLLAYSGTLLLVSHDRAFLNNLVTSTISLDGAGNAKETVGGYDDWLRQSQEETVRQAEEKVRKTPAAAKAAPQSNAARPQRLSYKEQRALDSLKQELADLPGRIEALEAEQHRLSAAMANPAFYQRDNAEITRDVGRLHELEVELAQVYQRWEDLESELGE